MTSSTSFLIILPEHQVDLYSKIFTGLDTLDMFTSLFYYSSIPWSIFNHFTAYHISSLAILLLPHTQLAKTHPYLNSTLYLLCPFTCKMILANKSKPPCFQSMTLNLSFVLNFNRQSYYTFLAIFLSLKSILHLISSQTNPFLPIFFLLVILLPTRLRKLKESKNQGRGEGQTPSTTHIYSLVSALTSELFLQTYLWFYLMPIPGLLCSKLFKFIHPTLSLSSTSFISHIYRNIFMNIQSYLEKCTYIFICE